MPPSPPQEPRKTLIPPPAGPHTALGAHAAGTNGRKNGAGRRHVG
jgi:hypothetical protein